MIQNSLPRLLEGIAQSLHDTVLPNVADSFARGQTLAAIELLRNLATRTQWGDEDARLEAQRLVDALAEPDAPTYDTSGNTPGNTSSDLLARLRAHVDDELSRTRSGMFSNPTAATKAGDTKDKSTKDANTKADNGVTGAAQ